MARVVHAAAISGLFLVRRLSSPTEPPTSPLEVLSCLAYRRPVRLLRDLRRVDSSLTLSAASFASMTFPQTRDGTFSCCLASDQQPEARNRSRRLPRQDHSAALPLQFVLPRVFRVVVAVVANRRLLSTYTTQTLSGATGSRNDTVAQALPPHWVAAVVLPTLPPGIVGARNVAPLRREATAFRSAPESPRATGTMTRGFLPLDSYDPASRQYYLLRGCAVSPDHSDGHPSLRPSQHNDVVGLQSVCPNGRGRPLKYIDRMIPRHNFR